MESVQHFALKLASKSWSQSYDSLLSSLNICSLEHRHNKAKLSLFYKIKHHLHHSTAPQCQHYTSARPLRYSSHLNFTVPFCRTSHYLHSFSIITCVYISCLLLSIISFGYFTVKKKGIHVGVCPHYSLFCITVVKVKCGNLIEIWLF